jgi:hypothetical protein
MTTEPIMITGSSITIANCEADVCERLGDGDGEVMIDP